MSSIFINPTLSDYKTAVRDYLNGNVFMNLNELMDYAIPKPVRSERITKSKSSEKLLQTEAEDSQYIAKRKAETINKLTEISKEVCSGEIGDFYGKDTLTNAFNTLNISSNFDAVFMLDSSVTLSTKSKKIATQNLISSITGFIVIEKGECQTKPYVYSVNLVCSKNKMGPILMGCALYCIKNTPGNHDHDECILELAGGYSNVPGFITYTRMGFRKNLMLYVPTNVTCFTSMDNLPMSVDLDIFENKNIIERATTKMLQDQFDDSLIYKTYIYYSTYKDKRDDAKMNTLVMCNQLLYKIQLSKMTHLSNASFLSKLYPEEKQFLTDYGLNNILSNETELTFLKGMKINSCISATNPAIPNMFEMYKKHFDPPKQTWGQYACQIINGVRTCVGCGTKKCKNGKKTKGKKRKQTKRNK